MPDEALKTMLSLMSQDEPLSSDEKNLLEFSREVVMMEMFGVSQEEIERQRMFVDYWQAYQRLIEEFLPTLPLNSLQPRVLGTAEAMFAMRRVQR
jgi:hypothetical protein